MARTYATICKVAALQLARLKMATVLRAPMRSRIGMFHAVVPDGQPLPDEYACRFTDFRQIVEKHIADGFRFVSLPELIAMPHAKNGYCALTFDDGYIGLYDLAAPYLFGHGIPFTAYITTGYLDTEGYLTSEALRSLSENPLCTVGSHLVTHPMTRFLAKDAVLSEMTESKRALERITGRPVEHLAFPYGSAYACSLRDIRLAGRAGYASAALTTPTVLGLCRPYRAYTLPRLDRFRV